MKEYMVLTIKSNEIIFNYRVVTDSEKKYVNKNSFYNNSLYYAYKYFKYNYDKIIDLLKEQSSLDTITIKKLLTFKYEVIFIIRLKLKHLKLDFPSTVSLNDYELFLTANTLKTIDCYFMPNFIKDKFDKKGVLVKNYNINKVSDRFMLQIDSFDYETLYYKKNLEIKENYDGVLDDIKEFLRINYNLKAIHIYVFSKDLISSIIELVKNDESRNIVVFLHQKNDKGNFIIENFKWLKELNKKCKKEYTCEFRIVYSSHFIGKNLFKQLSYNNLKLIMIFSFYVCLVCIIINKSYQYVEKLSIEELNNNLMNESLINETTATDDLQDGGIVLDEKEEKEAVSDKYKLENTFSSLKKINKETVGYLIVNNTKISYPVVQHSDNSYYLKKDFYKKSASIGWIYLDYRNSKDELDKNNIIYGHNMKNGTMFGSLSKALSSTWRKDEENMIISYDIEDANYQFKIFSVYKVDYTTDYLKVDFDSDEEFKSFIKTIKNRSVFKSKENITVDSKILTLSTCIGSNNKRLVVHAVLLEEE